MHIWDTIKHFVGQVTHQAGPYPGFSSMKRLRDSISATPGWDATLKPSIKFASAHLYTWLERGTVRVKCLAQEHNTMSQPGLEPGPLDLDFRALTMRPLQLPKNQNNL